VRKDGYEPLTKIIDYLRDIERPPPAADEIFLCIDKENNSEEEK